MYQKHINGPRWTFKTQYGAIKLSICWCIVVDPEELLINPKTIYTVFKVGF